MSSTSEGVEPVDNPFTRALGLGVSHSSLFSCSTDAPAKSPSDKSLVVAANFSDDGNLGRICDNRPVYFVYESIDNNPRLHSNCPDMCTQAISIPSCVHELRERCFYMLWSPVCYL